MAASPYDKLAVKWLGWLAYFLMMDKEERVKFARNDEEVELTRQQLTKELYGLKKYSRESTTKSKTARNTSRRDELLFQQKTSRDHPKRRKTE
jgi:hypothetical protein